MTLSVLKKEVTAMDVEKTADEAINSLADILYDKQGPSVNLTPVFNDYENREDIRDIKCEIQKIQSLSEDVDKAISDIIYMYISYGAFAEGDKKLKDSESLLLILNRILGNYEKYLTEVRTDLEFEKRRYGLIFKEG
jgi:hypothetical protein